VSDRATVVRLRFDDGLKERARLDERQSRIVELRYFTGLSIEETAVAMGTSPATVSREWTTARAWLFLQISARPPE
jgi:RNA polymerase sigma factor (sigma-70 family)